VQRLTVEPIVGPLPPRRSHAEAHDEVLTGDLLLSDPDGKPLVLQRVLDPSYASEALRRALPGLQWEATWDGVHGPSKNEYRLSGIVSAHQTFGNVAPMKLRRRFGCATSSFSRGHPRVDRALRVLGGEAWLRFAEILPEVAETHEALVTGRILDDWLLDSLLPFTSGIINNSAALPYHRDASNVPGSWSLMICLRRDVEGGHLHIPGYGVTLGVEDLSVIVFDGQAHLHGVTPMRRTDRRAFRYTIVYYAKAGCGACGPRAQEVVRAARVATEHYEKVARERG
jgi:hypothetical protein